MLFSVQELSSLETGFEIASIRALCYIKYLFSGFHPFRPSSRAISLFSHAHREPIMRLVSASHLKNRVAVG